MLVAVSVLVADRMMWQKVFSSIPHSVAISRSPADSLTTLGPNQKSQNVLGADRHIGRPKGHGLSENENWYNVYGSWLSLRLEVRLR